MSTPLPDLPDPLIEAIRRAAKEVRRRAESQHAYYPENRLSNALEDYRDDIETEIVAAWAQMEEEKADRRIA